MRHRTAMRLLALLTTLAALFPMAGFAAGEGPAGPGPAVEASIVSNEMAPAEADVSETGDISLIDLTGEGSDGSNDSLAAEGEVPASEETGGTAPEEEPAADEPQEAPPALAESALKLGVKEKYQLTLEGGVSPADIGAVFTSTKPAVAAVDKATGAVTARKKGSATIEMRVGSERIAACAVTVLAAPSKVTLSSKALTLGIGEEVALKAKLPAKTASQLKWSSSNKKIVTVDGKGKLSARKKGTATITVKTFNGKKATCKVTVKAAPTSVAFSNSSVSVWVGDSVSAKPKLSSSSAGAYQLTSSNEAAVTIKDTNLNAVAPGSSTITVTTYNGLTAEMSVEVHRKPVYRALLIAETTFPGTRLSDLPSATDVSYMQKMLGVVKGATKTKWTVTAKRDRTSRQIHSDIRAAFADAVESDVSLFYISTHGDEVQSYEGDWPEYVGYLMAYPDKGYTNWYDRYALTLGDLAEWLKEVPGQVVVIIDSCGSGAAIYGPQSNGAAAFSPVRFDKDVVNAFEGADENIMAEGPTAGAFLVKNKFFVLTSAGYRETCYTKNGKYSYFTRWLVEGIAAKGKMPADANNNKITTLNELYKYIKKRGDSTVVSEGGAKQHVQVYPSGSAFGLFYRK